MSDYDKERNSSSDERMVCFMEDIRNEQIEALRVMVDYIPKLKKGMTTVSAELSGERLSDTDDYLAKVIEGLNWVIEVLNGTLSLINEKEVRLDKEQINESAVAFSAAYTAKDDAKMASLLTTDLAEFVDRFEQAAQEFI